MPYLVMEYLEGSDLRKELRQRGPLSLPRALHVGIQVLRALEAAHAAYVVHRDLKPANIFLLSRDGDRDFVKVVDFGLSKLEETEVRQTRLTHGNVAMGTPLYMAPEQARDARSVTASADVYSAAAVLFECLTGKPPLSANDTGELFVKLLHEVPPRVDSLVQGVPAEVADIIALALSKTAKARPSPHAFAQVLARFAGPGSDRVAAWLRDPRGEAAPPAGAPVGLAALRARLANVTPGADRLPFGNAAADPLTFGFLGGLAFAVTFLVGVWILRYLGIGG